MGRCAAQPPVSWPWRRQPGESYQAYRAFELYRDGAVRGVRSIRQTASVLGKSRQLLERWSRRWSWVRRCAAFDRALDRLRLARRLAEIEAEAVRQAREEAARKFEPFYLDMEAAGHLLPMDDLIELIGAELGDGVAEGRPNGGDVDTRGWAKRLERSVM